MAFNSCSGKCKLFAVKFNPKVSNYTLGFVRCVTCVCMMAKDDCKKSGKTIIRNFCPCCNSQVRTKPRHHTRNNRLGIDNRRRAH
jgi:hypothetical protein